MKKLAKYLYQIGGKEKGTEEVVFDIRKIFAATGSGGIWVNNSYHTISQEDYELLKAELIQHYKSVYKTKENE